MWERWEAGAQGDMGMRAKERPVGEMERELGVGHSCTYMHTHMHARVHTGPAVASGRRKSFRRLRFPVEQKEVRPLPGKRRGR